MQLSVSTAQHSDRHYFPVSVVPKYQQMSGPKIKSTADKG